jgi:phosphohistidine swiveling domain-containing protein
VIPDPDATWTFDGSHYPEPLTPMTASVWFEAMGLGIQAACRELRAPFGGFRTTTVDHWAYESEVEPDWTPDPAVFREACLDVAARWSSGFEAEIDRGTAEVRAMRPARPAAPEAVAMLDRMMEIVHNQWRIHFVVVLGVHVSREILAERYAELLGGDELEPYRLLEGLPNATLDADDDLAELATMAERLDVADLILELPADHALTELRRLNDGRELLAALDVHLAAFGARSRLHELAEPRYAERPEFVIESVRLLLERPRAAAEERDRRAAERDRLEEEVLARIDPADRDGFAALLARVKAAAPLEEGHTLHIDQRGLQAVREALLGFGARLVAEGRLDRADQVFLVDRHELRRALSRDHGRGLQVLARRRRLELEAAAAGTPELVLGRPAPADATPDPMFVKFYGTPGEARGDGAHLIGYGASPGHAVGTARIVRSAADLGRVSAGDILVCTTTTPSWTPVFASVAGIVTDTGGILCHAAVVAREYGLPAVVGAHMATSRISEGSRVTLDGATGDVWIG